MAYRLWLKQLLRMLSSKRFTPSLMATGGLVAR